jgi:hypothetical protein
MNNDNDKYRYMLVGTGRSGSSLLSAIIADAGANFDMPNVSAWDRRSGAYEHPELINSYKWFLRSKKMALLSDRLRRFCEIRTENKLSTLLDRAVFAKYPHAFRLIHFTPELEFYPKIILSYRDFAGYSKSMYRKNGMDMPNLIKSYKEINSTALLQLEVFGGVAINYKELVDKSETNWAETISSLTGIDFSSLLESREKRVQLNHNMSSITKNYSFDSEINAIYSMLNQSKGEIF